jgi:hypothetical protein
LIEGIEQARVVMLSPPRAQDVPILADLPRDAHPVVVYRISAVAV